MDSNYSQLPIREQINVFNPISNETTETKNEGEKRISNKAAAVLGSPIDSLPNELKRHVIKFLHAKVIS